jgi:uncharacterized protein
MNGSSGVAVVRAFYDAFASESYNAAVREFLHEGIVWQVAGSNPLAGTFIGRDQVLAAMASYGEHSDHTLKLDNTSILGDDEHVVAIHHARASRGRLEYEAHEIDVFHVDRGRIVAMWSFSEDQAATDAMWS